MTGLGLLAFRQLRWLGALLLAFCWSLWQFQQRLDDRLRPELAGTVLTVPGVVVSIPQELDDGVRFRFRPQGSGDGSGDAQISLPPTLLVSWYEPAAAVDAGQRWELTLLLKPPWGGVNFSGPDRERWLFAAGIGGLATVRSGGLLDARPASSAWLAVQRERIAVGIRRAVDRPRPLGVLLALAIAERSALEPSDRRLLAATGTSHLLAISGLHVGMAAAVGTLLTRALTWVLPTLLPARGLTLLGLAGGALCAIAYTALADFGVATVRSLLMALTVLLAIAATRRVHPGQAWLLALAAVLLVDPFAPLGAGFWLSFAAVAALLWVFVPRPGRRAGPGLRALASLALAQAAVLLALLPLSAAWFQAASWVGFAANLVAIPVVSALLLPLVLAGVASMEIAPALAGFAWNAAALVTDGLLTFLEHLAQLPDALHPLVAPGRPAIVLGVLGALLLLAARGLPGRWIGAFLLLPLLLRPAPRAAPSTLVMDVLDVGQGTAVLLSTAGRGLLYDTGPGDGDARDQVSGVILPALRAAGLSAPDRIVISHGDLDHAGGLGSLRRVFPRSPLNVNLRRPPGGAESCSKPLEWRWRLTRFRVIHPSPALPYLGNDSSCVLDVRHGRSRVLLAGDISAAVEARLVRDGLGATTVLLVPHHGSLTSSSSAFVAALHPALAIATAALGNRFGFPKPEVRQRFAGAGSRFLTTGDCGALRMRIEPGGVVRVSSARLARPAPWRWPAAPGCPADEVFSVSFGHPENTPQSTE